VASLEGVAEEARTRGFASPSFGGFAFIFDQKIRLFRIKEHHPNEVMQHNAQTTSATVDVAFGSTTEVQHLHSPAAAIAGEAATQIARKTMQ